MAEQAKRKISEDVRIGKQLVGLLGDHEPKMTEVLPAGARQGLVADLEELQTDADTASVAKREAKVATTDQDSTVKELALKVSLARDSVKRTHPKNKSILQAFGVGVRFNSKSVSSTSEAMKAVLSAADKYPEAAREAAITPSIIESMKATLVTVAGADSLQEEKKVSAKSRLQRRLAAQLRVERTIDRIIAAANMAFMGKPEAELFRAVLTRQARAPKKKEDPAPGTNPTPPVTNPT